MKQRAEIIFEIEETVLLRQGPATITEHCPHCEAYVALVTPRAAGILANVSERIVFRFIEAGEVHFIERDGIFICLNSLAAIKGEVKQ